MDKGFGHKALTQAAAVQEDVFLLARCRDYKKAWYEKEMPPVFWQLLLDKIRKPIEGVISVLTECLGIEHILARSDAGIYRRTAGQSHGVFIGPLLQRGARTGHDERHSLRCLRKILAKPVL